MGILVPRALRAQSIVTHWLFDDELEAPPKAQPVEYKVVRLPDRKAKGSSRNFRKRQCADRGFIRGDRITTTEHAIWLRVGRR